MDLYERIEVCKKAFDGVNDSAMKLSMLCVLFDHICETDGLDKAEKINTIRDMVVLVNRTHGDMYQKGGN